MKEKLPGVLDKTDGLLAKMTTAVENVGDTLQDMKKVAANAANFPPPSVKLFPAIRENLTA